MAKVTQIVASSFLLLSALLGVASGEPILGARTTYCYVSFNCCGVFPFPFFFRTLDLT